MPRLAHRGEHGAMLLQPPPNCEIVFDRRIFDYILQELHRYPSSEEGGKYIGYIDLTDRHRGKDRVIITDFLPGGPNATRTAVEFLPDGEFQEQLFRRTEKRDANIEHLGSWHSHHCNGLDRLSGGDIEGYFKTVNKPAYRPDVFVASLVKHLPRNPHSSDWIDHFVFIRNHDRFYKITSHVTIADAPTNFGDITGHLSAPEQPAKPTSHRFEVESPTTLWNETEIGRKTLAEDKMFFTERFGHNVRATRRDGVITITSSAGPKFISISYPLKIDDREITINIGSASETILRIHCENSHRHVAYAASLRALESI